MIFQVISIEMVNLKHPISKKVVLKANFCLYRYYWFLGLCFYDLYQS